MNEEFNSCIAVGLNKTKFTLIHTSHNPECMTEKMEAMQKITP